MTPGCRFTNESRPRDPATPTASPICRCPAVRAHPLADAFPKLADDELRALADDITANGLREPITCFEGMILDGRNRFAACELSSVAPAFIEHDGSDPVAFVVSKNLARRHLNESQRALVASRLATLQRGYNEQSPDLAITQPQAAKSLKVSTSLVKQAKRIEREAPELLPKIEAGEMSLGRAERVIRDQQAADKRADTARAQASVAAIPVPGPDVRLGAFQEVLADVTDVDLIFTDPPYPAEYLPLWTDLSAWAESALRPGGKLLAYTGQYHLPEVIRRLSEHLQYEWLGWLETPGAHYTTFQRGVYSNGKPLLFFSRPPIQTTPRYPDTFTSEKRTRDLHEWEQDAAAAYFYIETLTQPGSLVCDPFAGSGTFALAAKALGRRFVGAEIDPDHHATAARRAA